MKARNGIILDYLSGLGDKHWIKNYQYRPTVLRLVEKFDELNHIDPYKILFIEDMEWEPGTAKNPWIAKTKQEIKAPL
ncbi:hypothetical protein [Marinisporobacter balticus]|uniref:Uncharacterized protein n=1 Tax=Marinisporobacter balticus TaxID=2018667 RepID=A0A4R2L5H8_9FIRM|nr:hypothetical protein [Marinisporobacter balticus]TCO79156.1 hypothetical protein EV214_103208 [Marinisporobacter balticus]